MQPIQAALKKQLMETKLRVVPRSETRRLNSRKSRLIANRSV